MTKRAVLSIESKGKPKTEACAPGVILLVTADGSLVQQLIAALNGNGHRYQLPIAVNLAQARRRVRSVARGGEGVRPLVILLDDSALESALWDAALNELADIAPVVLLMNAEHLDSLLPADAIAESIPDKYHFSFRRTSNLKDLLACGKLEFVPRTAISLPLAVGLIERHARKHEVKSITDLREVGNGSPSAAAAEFGETLRHEINNPLTGILGNAELLLARRDQLPAFAIARLETITELAIRLRETVRQFSDICLIDASEQRESVPLDLSTSNPR